MPSGRVRGMSRLRVRRQFEARFTAAHMAEGYLRVYERCMAEEAATSRPSHPRASRTAPAGGTALPL